MPKKRAEKRIIKETDDYRIIQESAGESLDRRSLIFLQCERINKIITMATFTAQDVRMRSEMLFNALDALEAMLIPGMTKEDFEKIDQIHRATSNEIAQINRGIAMPGDESRISNSVFFRSKQRYKMLWNIIRDVGLLPEREGTWEEK